MKIHVKHKLTACWIYSHICSLKFCVRASVLTALSISPIIPSSGRGRCLDRIIPAVVTEGGSGPMCGDEERLDKLSRDIVNIFGQEIGLKHT